MADDLCAPQSPPAQVRDDPEELLEVDNEFAGATDLDAQIAAAEDDVDIEGDKASADSDDAVKLASLHAAKSALIPSGQIYVYS